MVQQRSDEEQPVIRRRLRKSQRRRDGLISYAHSVHSQNGEDGILKELFRRLDPSLPSIKWCVDVGAWDGQHLSNTHELLLPSSSSTSSSPSTTEAECGWRGILLEADPEKFRQLQARYHHPPDGTTTTKSATSPETTATTTCLCVTVSASHPEDPNNLCEILKRIPTTTLPRTVDFICIDIDGADYWVWHDLLLDGPNKGDRDDEKTNKKDDHFSAKVVCIEFNPTMPDDLIYIPPRASHKRHGASLAALVELAEQHDYVLVETTLYNAFFVQRDLYELHLQDLVPDTSIEALHESTMGTELYQLYDGTLKLWGCKKMLWHRIAMDESKLQLIPEGERDFPFAPQTSSLPSSSHHIEEDGTKWMDLAVDLSPIRLSQSNEDTAMVDSTCEQLLEQLETNGFALVRGTGMDPKVCREALMMTQTFLQDVDESVRRSCLSSQDRARRGYSPMNVENFASLLGEQGPNDLVRKFRVGPLHSNGIGTLLQPNIWPNPSEWDQAIDFQTTTEKYYRSMCKAANLILSTVCRGLVKKHPELETSLRALHQPSTTSPDDSDESDGLQQTTSILTLLGYRDGTRHKGKNKGPLVAAHTDVGVITVLLFDGGKDTCAGLQRRDGDADADDRWIDIDLPVTVPDDPIFCVNVADCLSELSGNRLPSTVHRVVARRRRHHHQSQRPSSSTGVPRNCCALFVGLDPECPLYFQGESESLSYEEWRRRRVAQSQQILRHYTTNAGGGGRGGEVDDDDVWKLD